MSTHTYDFFIAGRWRNRDAIARIAKQLRDAGKKVYCFTDNSYEGHGVTFDSSADADPEAMMAAAESLTDWQTNPTYRKIYEDDMHALKGSERLVLVFPAGLSSHMELGVAYGLGKECYTVGKPDKPETLYLMATRMFDDVKSLMEHIQ